MFCLSVHPLVLGIVPSRLSWKSTGVSLSPQGIVPLLPAMLLILRPDPSCPRDLKGENVPLTQKCHKSSSPSSSRFSKTNASIRFPPEPISRALKLWILMILTSWIQRNHWSLPAIIIDTHTSLLFWSILKIGTKTWFSMRTNIKALHQV